MTHFFPLSAPQELDFFSIYEDNGIKFIHIFGYSYEGSGAKYESENNPNGVYWGNVECTWFIFPLSEFISSLRENGDFVDETYQVLNQYQDNLTAEEMTDTINHYFDGKSANEYLPFEEITMDTPCENYVRKI